MNTSTRFTLWRIKFQHKNHMLKVSYPKAHKAIATLMFLGVFALPIAGYLIIDARNNPKVLSAQDKLEIKNYSVNGQIVNVQSNSVTVRVNMVESSGDQSRVVIQDKTYLVSDNSQIITVSLINGSATINPAKFSDITAGTKVAVYSSTNPTTSSELTAERIELINL